MELHISGLLCWGPMSSKRSKFKCHLWPAAVSYSVYRHAVLSAGKCSTDWLEYIAQRHLRVESIILYV